MSSSLSVHQSFNSDNYEYAISLSSKHKNKKLIRWLATDINLKLLLTACPIARGIMSYSDHSHNSRYRFSEQRAETLLCGYYRAEDQGQETIFVALQGSAICRY